MRRPEWIGYEVFEYQRIRDAKPCVDDNGMFADVTFCSDCAMDRSMIIKLYSKTRYPHGTRRVHELKQRELAHKTPECRDTQQGAMQTLEAFQPVIAIQGRRKMDVRLSLYKQLLDAIAIHRVADRPDRFEPRLRKRRPKHYGYLRKPRAETKREMVKDLG